MPEQKTHAKISPDLVGKVVSLAEGSATVTLHTLANMAADDRGLVHGGFVFGAADYAAMLAVNDPNVVLGSSNIRFTAPVQVGQTVTATATRTAVDRRKHTVEVVAHVGERTVLKGTIVAFVLDKHVLDG
jgi:acyl-coenzyme A thioesterase PaaI-like protein